MNPKLKKSLKITGITLASILTLLILTILFWLGPTIKLVLETLGPKALGTPVELEYLSINPRKGTLDLTGFQIGMHDEFSLSNTVHIGELHVSLDMRSLFSDTIVIHNVDLQSPHFAYEQNAASDNVMRFIENLQEFVGIDPDKPKKPKRKKAKKLRGPAQVMIEQLAITDLRTYLSNTDDPTQDLILALDCLTLSLTNGLVELNHFNLSDPGLLTKEHLVSLDHLRVKLQPDTIYSIPIIIDEIDIDSPHLFLEENPYTGTFTELVRIADSFIVKIENVGTALEAAREGHDLLPTEPITNQVVITQTNQPPPEVIQPVVLHNLIVTDAQLHLVDKSNTANPEKLTVASIGELAVSPTGGTIDIDHIALSNPETLTLPNLFELESIRIRFIPESLNTKHLQVEEVAISRPHLYLEANSDSTTLLEFMELANSFVEGARRVPLDLPERAAASSTPAHPSATQPAPPLPDRVTINDLRLNILDATRPNAPIDLTASIQTINLNLMQGELLIDRIAFSHPTGFALTNLFMLDKITVVLDPASLTTATPVIKEVQILQPHTSLELAPDHNTAQVLMQVATSFTPPAGSIPAFATAAEAETLPAEPESVAAAAPLELHNLLIENIQLQLLNTTHTNVEHRLRTLASIEEIRLKLSEGQARIGTIQVVNPDQRFRTPYLLKLNSIDVSLDPESLFSDQAVIQEVFIDSPDVNLEQTDRTGNVSEYQLMAEAFMPPTAPPGASVAEADATQPSQEAAPASMAELPVILNSLIVTNFAVHMNLPRVVEEEPAAPNTVEDAEALPARKEKEEHPATMLSFDQLTLEPPEGLIQIHNIQVINPEGFANKHLVKLELFRLDLDPDTLLADTLLIEDVLLQKPRIAYELKFTTDNIKALQQSIELAVNKREVAVGEIEPAESEQQSATATNRAAPVDMPTPALSETHATEVAEVQTPPVEEQNDGEQKVIIQKVLVADGLVKAKLFALPSVPIPLPNITLTDIGGKDGGGATLSDATTEVGTTIYDSIVGSVSGATGMGGDALKSVGSFGLGALGGLSDGFKSMIGVNADEEIILHPDGTYTTTNLTPVVEGELPPESAEETVAGTSAAETTGEPSTAEPSTKAPEPAETQAPAVEAAQTPDATDPATAQKAAAKKKKDKRRRSKRSIFSRAL